MHKPLSDSGIYIKKLEETLLSIFEQWREVTAALYRYLGKSECNKVRDLDCIDWFCSDMKARLKEIKKRGGHPGLWRFTVAQANRHIRVVQPELVKWKEQNNKYLRARGPYR
ncbi:MAG: hypothetical protein GY845_19870 [Planctomycetes bacterium]|nr:hypothetical protein [Planctomycetota bacterium]